MEQKHLVTERLCLRADRETVQKREAAVTERENRLQTVVERLHAKEEKSKHGLLGFKRAPLSVRRLVLASRNPDWIRITFASCCSHEANVVSPAHHREET